jgi:4-carboxymuconolactone decarboxylase
MPPVSIPTLDGLPQPLLDSLAKLVAPVNVGVVCVHSPVLLAPMVDYAMAVLKGLELAGRHRELAIMAVAAHTHSEYLFHLHLDFARTFGLSDRAAAGQPVDNADETDVLVQSAAYELLRTDTLTEDTSTRLVETLGEKAVVELACVVGYYRLLALLANAAQLPVDTKEALDAVEVLASDLVMADD